MMNAASAYCYPLAANYAHFPLIPAYPYSASLTYYVKNRQVNPFFADVGIVEGIRTIDLLDKRSVWPKRFINLGNFALVVFFNNGLSWIAKKLNLIEHDPQIPNLSTLSVSFELLKLEVQMEGYRTLFNRLINEIDDDPEKQQQLKNDLREVESKMNEIMVHKAGLERKLIEVDEELDRYRTQSCKGVGMKHVFFKWFFGHMSSLLAMTILFPLNMVGNWYIIADKHTTWGETKDLMFDLCFKQRTKNAWDGLFITCIEATIRSLIIVPPMNIIKKFMNLPHEIEMTYHFNNVFSTLLTTKIELSTFTQEQRKARAKESISLLAKNTVAYAISNTIVGIALYPLQLVSSKMICRQSSDSSTLDLISSIYRQNGYSGFYNGFLGRMLMVNSNFNILIY